MRKVQLLSSKNVDLLEMNLRIINNATQIRETIMTSAHIMS